MKYPIETSVAFQYRVPNRATGGEAPLYVKATVTDHGPESDLPFPENQYTVELFSVCRGAENILPTLDMMHKAGYCANFLYDIISACERQAFDQNQAVTAHVDRTVDMPEYDGPRHFDTDAPLFQLNTPR